MAAPGGTRYFTLKEREELRIEVTGDKKANLLLVNGDAEVFGTMLAVGQRLPLENQKLAVFTWSGCRIQVEGTYNVAYTAGDTPMVLYMNVNHILHNRRQQALEQGEQGPRTIVVGPPDSGKSSLVSMLVNWAVRTGGAPMLVDLDVGHNSITVPGCIAATPIEEPTDLEDGLAVHVPLIYFYGSMDVTRNPELYKFLLDRLSARLDERAQTCDTAAGAGMFINTPGWIDGLGYELLLHAIRTFKADVVLVVEQDRLYSQLCNELHNLKVNNHKVDVVKLQKSGGVVSHTEVDRRQSRITAVRHYFYGVQRSLSPHMQQMRTSDFKVWSIGGGPRAPSHALPLGTVSAADPLRLSVVKVDRRLVHSLLAVSHAKKPDELTTANIAGFVVVTDVNEFEVTFLSPNDRELPANQYLLEGTISDSSFVES